MKRQYLYTERAHLMCPNMCFGIAATINAPYDADRIKNTIEALENAHPFLKAVLGYEENNNRYFYDITDIGQVQWTDMDEEWNGFDDWRVMKQYEKAVSYDWNLFKEGMLRIVSWKSQNQLGVLFICHHLLADGRGCLGLVQEFSDMYVHGKIPLYVEECLIGDIGDLPKGVSINGISRWLINVNNKKWKRENSILSYEEYHQFADEFVKKDNVTHKIIRYTSENLKSIMDQCHKFGISLNDYLMARMYTEEHTDKIIIASDVRDKLRCYREGALGNYSTAFSVSCKNKNKNVLEVARTIHKRVQKILINNESLFLILACYGIMEPGLLDAAASSALGGYSSKTGSFVGGSMFGFKKKAGYSITNLGKIESKAINSAMFIPPASPAIKKIQGVLTVNGRMIICSSERK